jgi:23S rRNA pseudouridine1911/1915/1917 synthase
LIVPAELDRMRLDVAVATLVEELSRTQVARLCDDGRVTVDGAPGKPSQRLRTGAVLSVDRPESEPTDLQAESIPLRIVHRDEAIIVVDKPAGMVVHPGHGHPSGTLANALLGLDPDLRVGMAHRPGLVHRLDRDTSGLMVVARTDAALRALQSQWASRETLKLYLALVVGVPTRERATIEAPIGRNPRDRQRMAVVADGRPATTDYRVLERRAGYALVEARIRTGRTHQIRVHFASIGHPVVGDETYGGRHPEMSRQFLHATRLGFRHPICGEWLELESPLPPDLTAFLDRLVA